MLAQLFRSPVESQRSCFDQQQPDIFIIYEDAGQANAA